MSVNNIQEIIYQGLKEGLYYFIEKILHAFSIRTSKHFVES